MAGLTLDAGALIAAEKGDRRFWALWELAERRDTDVTVPANVIAQVYRGARSATVARLLRACVVEIVDEELAKVVGVACGKTRNADVVDVCVVVGAARRGDHIVTSDKAGIEQIAARIRGVAGVIAI